MKTIVTIEKGNDGSYGAYLANNDLPFGIIGDGQTAKEAVADFLDSYEEARKHYWETNKKNIECDFEFRYDVPSFFVYCGSLLSPTGMERLIGVNPKRLSQYITGRRKPSESTVKKITAKLHAFGKELSQIEFA